MPAAIRCDGYRDRCRRAPLLVPAAVLIIQASLAIGQQPALPGAYQWLDVEGRPLPYQEASAIREVLGTARVVSRHRIPQGVTGAEKLVLEHEGVRFHAAFRSVDVEIRSQTPRSSRRYRDAAIFEAAAYELSRLYGIERVPPVVERRIDTSDGTLQIWMEETIPQILANQCGLRPPDTERWFQQKQTMILFDTLIGNTDRNQGNMLIDRRWTLWYIDHTRAFTRSSRIPASDRLTACERTVWAALREVDEETLRQRLAPLLEDREISKLVHRRRNLIRHIQGLIARRGEDAVLFELREPGATVADWQRCQEREPPRPDS